MKYWKEESEGLSFIKDDKTDGLPEFFKKQRNLVNKLCRKAMAEYHDKKFPNSKGNMKETWKLINEVTGGNAETGGNEVQLEGFIPL